MTCLLSIHIICQDTSHHTCHANNINLLKEIDKLHISKENFLFKLSHGSQQEKNIIVCDIHAKKKTKRYFIRSVHAAAQQENTAKNREKT